MMPDSGGIMHNASTELRRVRCAIYRGGTSRAVIFRGEDVPTASPALDAFLLQAMGSPHVRQIDGLGGAHPATSKVAIVARSKRPDCDLDYTFAQVDIERPRVDYSGLCGNISAAVGPFAVDAGMVEATGDSTRIRIHNTNTGGRLTAYVPTRDGRVLQSGDYAIDGAPGRGAKIFLDYSGTAGAFNGNLLPTGRSTDTLKLESGQLAKITICDLANPMVFVHAAALGAKGDELPVDIEQNQTLIALQREIRGRAAVLLGLIDDWRAADEKTPVRPILIAVASPLDAVCINGSRVMAPDIDLSARCLFMNRCHEAMAGSGALVLAAASRVPGSVVHSVLRSGAIASPELRIGHPSGSMAVEISASTDSNGGGTTIHRVGIGRTTRPIMDGTLFLPVVQG